MQIMMKMITILINDLDNTTIIMAIIIMIRITMIIIIVII